MIRCSGSSGELRRVANTVIVWLIPELLDSQHNALSGFFCKRTYASSSSFLDSEASFVEDRVG